MKYETKQLDKLLVNDNEMLQSVLENAGGLIYQYQHFPCTKTSCFPYTNNCLLDIYELTPEEVRFDSTPLHNRIHIDDWKNVSNTMKISMQTLTEWNLDYRVVLPKKGLRWLRGYGKPEKLDDGSYLWNGCVIDITEQKAVELELYKNKQRLQLALESSKNGLWDWNVEENTVYYSKESLSLLGYESDEIKNTSQAWDQRVHPDDFDTYMSDIDEHFQEKTPFYSNEHRVKCKDGTYKWILDRGKVIERKKNGKPLRVIGTHSDITVQKLREEDVIKKMDKIEEQNDRLSNFAHIVSHNLRSHSGNFEMLMEIINTSKDQQEKGEVLKHLNNVSNALKETISHLKEIVSVQSKIDIEIKQLELNKYINKTVKTLSADINKKEAQIINNLPSEVLIDFNPAYLESILLNLFTNALKYKHPERKPQIILNILKEEGQLKLIVTDNGMGIDMDRFRENLFGMYKTFHGNKDAVGIGLFITKNQIEALHGKIDVESEVNIGSDFIITFSDKLN